MTALSDWKAHGIYLSELEVGQRLTLETRNHRYHLMNEGGGEAMIFGHPQYCPEPVSVKVAGSTWGGSMLKMGFIGVGMRLEFAHPDRGVVTTSGIRDIHSGKRILWASSASSATDPRLKRTVATDGRRRPLATHELGESLDGAHFSDDDIARCVGGHSFTD